MEPKTIGSFIAALRKANGMTQRDLAERLNVSDKTVSRWERDDGAPDLSLIPVIAELFGVTCDELLRGERKPAEQRADSANDAPVSPDLSVKAEKAMKRILREAMTAYRTRSMIALAIAAAGLIAALVANSFNRANLGFWLCCAFELAAGVCQGAFLNRALFAISAEDFPEADVYPARRSLVDIASRVFCVIAVLVFATLPMLLVVPDSYYGINGDAWFVLAAGLGLAAWGVWCFGNDEVIAVLTRRGFLRMGEKQSAAFHHNNRLKWKVTKVLAVALAVTGAAHGFMYNFATAYDLAEPIVFNDYESFKAYMENDTMGVTGAYVLAQNEEPVEIIGSFKRQLTLADGTVVLEYLDLNENVLRISYTEHDGSLLPIAVITQSAVRVAQTWVEVRNVVFCLLYAVEAAAAILVYGTKKERGRS